MRVLPFSSLLLLTCRLYSCGMQPTIDQKCCKKACIGAAHTDLFLSLALRQQDQLGCCLCRTHVTVGFMGQLWRLNTNSMPFDIGLELGDWNQSLWGPKGSPYFLRSSKGDAEISWEENNWEAGGESGGICPSMVQKFLAYGCDYLFLSYEVQSTKG